MRELQHQVLLGLGLPPQLRRALVLGPRRLLAGALGVLCLLGAGVAPPPAAAGTPGPAPAQATAPAPLIATDAATAPARALAHVTYVTGGSVYVDAGESDGLRERDTLVVVRGDSIVARVAVSYLSIHRAACDTVSTLGSVRPGDTVRYTPHPAPATALTPDFVADTSHTANRPGALRPRGRLGLRWLSLEAGKTTLSQPSFDARLDATALGGALGLTGDFRGRHGTTRISGAPDFHDDRDFVYRLSMSLRGGEGRNRLTLGRMLSPTLAAAGVFDGALLERVGRRWSGGVFGGTQPDPVTMGVSGTVLQEGAFVRWQTDPASVRRASLQVGAVSSTDHGQANRDFAFAEGRYFSPTTSAFLQQQADLSRGWKRTLGQDAVVFSGTNGSFTHRIGAAIPYFNLPANFDLYAGFDSRRNVWLYRDRATPETQFDARLRQGGWAGGAFDRYGHLKLSGEFRSNGVAWTHSQTGWSAALQAYAIGRAALGLAARMTQLGSQELANTLISATVSAAPLASLQLSVTGGTRTSKDVVAVVSEHSSWVGGDLDLALPARAYVNASWQEDRGGAVPIRQLSAALGWSF